jgi:hypothetical protein
MYKVLYDNFCVTKVKYIMYKVLYDNFYVTKVTYIVFTTHKYKHIINSKIVNLNPLGGQ